MNLSIKHSDVERLVNLLARNSLAAPAKVGIEGYFMGLIKQANLPDQFKLQRSGGWTGEANFDARELINWAITKDVNPADKRYTTLGSILEPELNKVGLDTASTLAAFINAYSLYRDQKLLDRLVIRYQIPQKAGEDERSDPVGPEINWAGPTEEIELQSWFRPEPDFLDVGYLKQGIEKSTSVCRIEVGKTGKTGTGVLMDNDLVLTNYHVLGYSNDEVKEAAKNTTLRFGVYTNSSGQENEGQEIVLDPRLPVVALSPIYKHDFVLLRTDQAIHKARDISPATFVIEKPSIGSGLNILQHPEGKAMMLALSSNGVTNVNDETGLIQYLTRTSGGSSGAPCFTQEWNLVALHHAERSKSFGVIREGILINVIYEKVREYLNTQPQ